MTNSTYT